MTYRLLLPLILGIAFCDWLFPILNLHPYPILGTAVGGALALWLLKQRLGDKGFNLALSTVMFLLGAFLQAHERAAIEHVTWSDENITYSLPHVLRVDERSKTYQVWGRIKGQEVQVTLEKDTTSVAPQLGDAILFKASIEKPRPSGNPGGFDYNDYLLRQGITGTAYCVSNLWKVTKAEGEPPLVLHFMKWRERGMAQLKQHLQGTSLAVIAAMTLGDKTMIEHDTRDVFSATGASHILALSGLHLSILYTLLMFTLGRMLRGRLRLYQAVSVVCMIGIWLFVGIAGAPLSLLRAAIMLTLLQGCQLLKFERSSLNHLTFAAFVLLLVSPQSLFDIGFQLSFLAVGGILTLTPLMKSNEDWHLAPKSGVRKYVHNVWCMICEMFQVSFAAQIATFALVGYYFHIIPTYALLVNFVVIPLTYIVLLVALFFFALPFAQAWCGIILHVVLQFMLWVLTETSSLPYAVWHWHPTLPVVFALYGLIGAYLWRAYSSKRTLQPIIMAGACLLGLTLYLGLRWIKPTEPTIWIYNTLKAEAVHVLIDEREHYLWSTDSARTDSALSYIKQHHWEAQQLERPIYLNTDTVLTSLCIYGQVMQVGQHRIAKVGYWKTAPLPQREPQMPLKVDALWLTRGATVPLPKILKFYTPQMLIFDASLSDKRKQLYQQTADSLHIPTHDIKREGAYMLRVLMKVNETTS